MGLDFSGIKDEAGAAIYVIHDGSSMDETKMSQLVDEIKHATEKQVILMSARDTVTASIMSFYGLTATHGVLIVRDDDQMHHFWGDNEVYRAADIAYLANQVD